MRLAEECFWQNVCTSGRKVSAKISYTFGRRVLLVESIVRLTGEYFKQNLLYVYQQSASGKIYHTSGRIHRTSGSKVLLAESIVRLAVKYLWENYQTSGKKVHSAESIIHLASKYWQNLSYVWHESTTPGRIITHLAGVHRQNQLYVLILFLFSILAQLLLNRAHRHLHMYSMNVPVMCDFKFSPPILRL